MVIIYGYENNRPTDRNFLKKDVDEEFLFLYLPSGKLFMQ